MARLPRRGTRMAKVLEARARVPSLGVLSLLVDQWALCVVGKQARP